MTRLIRFTVTLATLGSHFLSGPDRAHGEGIRPPQQDVIGVVQDGTGVPLPNARVVIAELGRGTTTGTAGTFLFRDLPAGVYHVDVNLIGYAPGHAVLTLPEDGAAIRLTIVLEISPLALSGIQVTASPNGADPLRVTQSTIQLAGKELSRNLGASVAATLADQPGMATRYAGPAANTPVIRGLSGERILILQDGQRTGDLSSTSADHGLSIDALSANQIEVVRGPASLLYGNNALGGVVNVISNDIPTTVPTHWEWRVAGQGESAFEGASISTSLVMPMGESGALSGRLGGRRLGDARVGGGGRLDNSQLRSFNGTLGGAFIGRASSVGAAYRGYGFEYGLPAPMGAEESGVQIEGVRHEVTGRGDYFIPSTIVPNIRVNGSTQWYRHDEIEPSGEIGTTFDLRTQNASVSARTEIGDITGALGVSALFEQYAPTGEEALTPPARSSSGGIFFFEDLPIGRGPENLQPHLQLGGRYDLLRIEAEAGADRFGTPETRDFGSFSGSVGLNLPVGPVVSASLNIARAYRAPTVEELFSNAFHAAVGSFDVGNRALDSETSTGVEGVFRAQTSVVSAQVAAYNNRIGNYITPTIVGDTVIPGEDGASIEVPLNLFRQADASLRGVEGSVEAALGETMVIGAMGDLLHARFRTGGPLPFMPAARGGVSFRWDDSRFSAGGTLKHTFAQGEVPNSELAASAYTLLNINGGVSLVGGGRTHSLTLRIDNVLDVLYREATSRIKDFAPNPGRNLAVVYSVLF